MLKPDTKTKTMSQWLKTQKFEQYEMVSPDGWKHSFEKDENKKTTKYEPVDISSQITMKEFMDRLMQSSFIVKPK